MLVVASDDGRCRFRVEDVYQENLVYLSGVYASDEDMIVDGRREATQLVFYSFHLTKAEFYERPVNPILCALTGAK